MFRSFLIIPIASFSLVHSDVAKSGTVDGVFLCESQSVWSSRIKEGRSEQWIGGAEVGPKVGKKFVLRYQLNELNDRIFVKTEDLNGELTYVYYDFDLLSFSEKYIHLHSKTNWDPFANLIINDERFVMYSTTVNLNISKYDDNRWEGSLMVNNINPHYISSQTMACEHTVDHIERVKALTLERYM
jgi:hypothetical protein